MTPARPQTAPHDYRVVCECEPTPTVVGGQAVNLWAINYLTAKVPKATLVSKDLDIVVSKEALCTPRKRTWSPVTPPDRHDRGVAFPS